MKGLRGSKRSRGRKEKRDGEAMKCEEEGKENIRRQEEGREREGGGHLVYPEI